MSFVEVRSDEYLVPIRPTLRDGSSDVGIVVYLCLISQYIYVKRLISHV